MICSLQFEEKLHQKSYTDPFTCLKFSFPLHSSFFLTGSEVSNVGQCQNFQNFAITENIQITSLHMTQNFTLIAITKSSFATSNYVINKTVKNKVPVSISDLEASICPQTLNKQRNKQKIKRWIGQKLCSNEEKICLAPTWKNSAIFKGTPHLQGEGGGKHWLPLTKLPNDKTAFWHGLLSILHYLELAAKWAMLDNVKMSKTLPSLKIHRSQACKVNGQRGLEWFLE